MELRTAAETLKTYIEQTKNDDFSVFAGTDSLILKTLQAGGAGAVAATANMLPDIVTSIYHHWAEGETEKAEAAQKLYQENTEGNYFIASNLTDSKTTLTSNGVTVSISGDATDKIMAKEIDGKRYLMISLEDPEVKVNGYQLNFGKPAEAASVQESAESM